MRTTVFKLARRLAAVAPFAEPIYEFGAAAAPGQIRRGRVRDCFAAKAYVGADLALSANVDEIHDVQQLALGDDSIGAALLFDMIEHVREPWRAMAEIHRCLRPGGLVVATSALYFPVHAHPDDYWRFTGSAFRVLFSAFEVIRVVECGLRKLPHTVVGVASKGPIDPELARRIGAAVDDWKRRESSSWKELGFALLPPIVLLPAYEIYTRIESALERRRATVIGDAAPLPFGIRETPPTES